MALVWVRHSTPRPPLDTAQVLVLADDRSQQVLLEGRRIRRIDAGRLVPAGPHIKAHLTS